MSVEITTAFVQQYKSNVLTLYQQAGSRLRGSVREESLTGKNYFFERLGATAAVLRTTRHSDTPLVDSPHSRRMVTLKDYEWADLVDQADKIRLLISPESEYARNAAMALGRAYDDEIIVAFDGTAKSGETGGTDVLFANDWPVTRSGTQGDFDFTAAAMTTPNILTIKKALDNNDVPADGRYLAVSPSAMEQLLKASTAPLASSADYNTIRALVMGDLDTWVGFKWITTTRLPVPAANQRFCFAWHRDSMGVGMGKDITVQITPRADKSYSTQVYCCGTYSATRVQGEGVVRFKISELN
jgi:hypothetical protein